MNQPLKTLRLDGVIQKIGLSKATIYNKNKIGNRYYDATFPNKVKLGLSAVGWLEHEVDAWLIAQASKRYS